MPYGREVVPAVSIPGDLLDEYNLMDVDLNTYLKEAMASFLIGETDINSDGDWEDYKQGLYAIGLERYMEIFNEAYAASPLKWGE